MASIYKIQSGWRAQVRLTGKPTVSKIFPTKNDAVRWARDEEHRLTTSRSDNPNLTFAELVGDYFERLMRVSPTKHRTIERVLLPYWGTYRMTEITTGTISTYAAKRARAGKKPATILQELTYLGVTLGHGGVLAGNREAQFARLELTAAVKSLRHAGVVASSEERDRRPTEEELHKLMTWFGQVRSDIPMADMVLFAIATCMRLGEITGPGGLRFSDVDLQDRTALLRGRKDPRRPGGRDEVVPLVTGHFSFHGSVIDPVEIIKRRALTSSGKDYVFEPREIAVTHSFMRATTNCAITNLHFHDLRHDGISRLFEAGYDIPKVAAISGHKTWKHLARYTHLRPTIIQK
jgi:integrase